MPSLLRHIFVTFMFFGMICLIWQRRKIKISQLRGFGFVARLVIPHQTLTIQLSIWTLSGAQNKIRSKCKLADMFLIEYSIKHAIDLPLGEWNIGGKLVV